MGQGKNEKKGKLVDMRANENDQTFYAVIETPRKTRNKFKYEVERGGFFKLAKVLPEGIVFPFDFGFIPNTEAEDGDPIDILVLMDEPGFPGALVEVRIIGVLEGQQREKHDSPFERNDRLIGVATASLEWKKYTDMRDLGDHVLHEIEQFFVNYNQLENREWKPMDRSGPKRARKLIRQALKAVEKNKKAS